MQSRIADVQSPLGFLTAYVPEELFHAAGFTPLFIFPTPEDRGLARVHLPGFTCWIAGSALDRALAGELDGLAGMVLGQTCDTIQGLTDLWRRNVPHVPLFHFGMPLRLDGPSARAYLLAELSGLRGRLEAHTGRSIPDDAVRESIALHNRTRTLVRRLYARAADLAPSDLYRQVRAAFSMPKALYNQELCDAEPESRGQAGGARIVLVGPALADTVLLDALDRVGVRVVGDLLDLGERYFAVDASEDGDPLETLADRLLALPPTPTKRHPERSRAAHLLALVEGRGADGVVFARQKFCDPHGFDCVQLAHALDEAGVPHLLVELEQASQAGQLRTRVEAFAEMMVI